MSPETIAERARAIRFSDKALGEAAGLAENTVYRTLSRRTRPLQDTADMLSSALTAEELRLRDYLLALHPVKQEGQAA
jgi:transcriptional regulator with XRE-family HTH domain